ncbi:MAG: hypothetical protein PHS54_04045 [Clostridia bacterium]|nr:hypothetical protein [Clostridia bacterium]
MKNIEKIKFIFGLTLVSFAIIGGLVFYLESFEILDGFLDGRHSRIFWTITYDDSVATSNTPIFLGLCGLAGAYLLSSVKPIKTEAKIEVASDQSTN